MQRQTAFVFSPELTRDSLSSFHIDMKQLRPTLSKSEMKHIRNFVPFHSLWVQALLINSKHFIEKKFS